MLIECLYVLFKFFPYHFSAFCIQTGVAEEKGKAKETTARTETATIEWNTNHPMVEEDIKTDGRRKSSRLIIL